MGHVDGTPSSESSRAASQRDAGRRDIGGGDAGPGGLAGARPDRRAAAVADHDFCSSFGDCHADGYADSYAYPDANAGPDAPTRTATETPVPPSATRLPTDTATRTPTRTPVPPAATRLPTWTRWTSRATPIPTVSAAAAVPHDELDKPPCPAFVTNPVYPPDDLKAQIRGVVVLSVLVSETGDPEEIVVLERARGHLTEAAVAAIRNWRFEPAFKSGRAVRTWTTVRIPFEAIPFPEASPTRMPPG